MIRDFCFYLNWRALALGSEVGKSSGGSCELSPRPWGGTVEDWAFPEALRRDRQNMIIFISENEPELRNLLTWNQTSLRNVWVCTYVSVWHVHDWDSMGMCLCMFVCVCACMHACMDVCVSMCVYKDTCAHVCTKMLLCPISSCWCMSVYLWVHTHLSASL